jgi:hypothetical protein
MKHVLFLSLFMIIFIGFSCKKKETTLVLSYGEIGRICLNLKNEFKEQPVLTIDLMTRHSEGSGYNENMAKAEAWASTDTTDVVIVNGITIPHKKVFRGSTFFSSRPYKPTDDINNREDLYGLFGQHAPVLFDSQTLGHFEDSLKISKPIQLRVNDTTFKSLPTLSLSKPLKLTWNKDMLNKNPVLIFLMSQPFSLSLSNKSAPFDTTKTMVNLQKHVTDNGFFEIKPSDLAIFPKGSLIVVSIMRGSYNLVKTSKGKPVLLSAVSEYSLMFGME